MVAGIEVNKAIVIPQHAIALARQKHGDADLRVYLCQSARQATQITITILKLSQAIEMLILVGKECQRGLPTLHLVKSGCEYGGSLTVLYRDRLTCFIHIDRHVATAYLLILHVEPIGQV